MKTAQSTGGMLTKNREPGLSLAWENNKKLPVPSKLTNKTSLFATKGKGSPELLTRLPRSSPSLRKASVEKKCHFLAIECYTLLSPAQEEGNSY